MSSGAQQMMRVVRLFPPNDSSSTRVSFESRVGTKACPSASALITMPSVVRLLLATTRKTGRQWPHRQEEESEGTGGVIQADRRQNAMLRLCPNHSPSGSNGGM